MRRVWIFLLAVTGLWILALIQFGQPLGWDEIEFFRASRWVAEGQVPYRDFFEHHTPLQWFVFAPFASLLGDGPGAGAVVAMRWVQLLVWAGVLGLVIVLARRGGLARGATGWAVFFLLASPSFVRSALEFRVDVVGHLGYVAAVLTASGGMSWRRGLGFGVLMSAAVLANMRLAPVVIATALLVAFCRPVDRRWGWNRGAHWMIPGAAAVAAAFAGWLLATGAWPAFVTQVIEYNLAFGRMLEENTFLVTLLLPVWWRDVAGLVFAGLALGGAGLALRNLRRPGILEFVAVAAGLNLIGVAGLNVQYPYHFQTVLLIAVPLAAAAAERVARWEPALLAAAAVSLGLNFLPLARTGFGEELRYQNAVMTEADRLTRPGEAVWDGCGYALRREPAFRYWFLPTVVRYLAAEGTIGAFDPAADPPAAIIHNLRLQRWFELFPKSAFFVVHHYVPRYRNLWVAGLSGAVPPRRRVVWTAPRTGEYDVYASELLLKHPWFSRPLEYAAEQGPRAARYAIPLNRLPLVPENLLKWNVSGRSVEGRRMTLRRGDRVELVSSAPDRIGVLVVPRGIEVLAEGPAAEFEF